MYAYAALALAGAAMAIPNPVPSLTQSTVKPSGSAPAGCSSSYSGTFEISIVNASTASTKRSIQKRTALELTLENGVLLDAQSRVGYIASNYQFQFDNPVQAGYIYDAGWSACSNGTLALGSSAVFYECLSGTFYNLYDESTGAQCSPIYIDIVPVSSSAAATTSVSQVTDGQVQASTAAVSQITDGQVQATTAVVSQITDGQIQATTATAAVVSQITDGQIQATTGTAHVVSQISDGQIQATTGTAHVVSQISDGQIQATTGTAHVVSQISDGQIQATTGTAHVVSQISDGQIQATSPAAVVSQISDGQIQATSAGTLSAAHATNGTAIAAASATASQTYTGAATFPTMKAELFGLAAGVLAMAML